MSEPICTCHCGGSMFYRHLHSDSCELSRVGEEAPMSPKKELQALRDENARLKRDVNTLNQLLRNLGYGQGEIDSMAAEHEAALTPQAGKGGGA